MVMYDQTNSSFIRSRKLGKPYVDKTGFIKALLARNMTVCLFTRPRRFGRSMNLTTLDAFLNLKYVSESEEWFKGLEIDGAEECKIHRNAYPRTLRTLGKNRYDFLSTREEVFGICPHEAQEESGTLGHGPVGVDVLPCTRIIMDVVVLELLKEIESCDEPSQRDGCWRKT